VLAVIVLSKDRPDLFRACAASVPGDAAYLSDKVLVQNGTDGETVAAAAAAGWQVIDTRGANLSFSAGNNLAARALGPHVTHLLLLNNDAVLHPGALDALWAARAEADVVGSFILDPEGKVDHAGVYFDCYLHGDHLGHGLDPDPYFPPGQDLHNLPAVTFACAMVSRAAWDHAGGLDESYWYCCEDTDLCLRVREHGGAVMVARDAVVTHAASSTRDPKATADVAEALFSRRWRDTGRLLRAAGTPPGDPWRRRG